MPHFVHAGIGFHYREVGTGLPFILQHGLGGDTNQPFRLFTPPASVRFLTMDCRAHGDTYPLGESDSITFRTFADDVVALMDYLGITYAVVGGISMGAAVALNLAVRHPSRISGLLLSRPAWLYESNPPNLHIYAVIAEYLCKYGAKEGALKFCKLDVYKAIAAESADTALSLVGQFSNPRAEEAVVRLMCVPKDTPVDNVIDITSLRLPTLVLANRQNPVHPYQYGEKLAELIPNAEFEELTPKSIDANQHAADFQRTVTGWLVRNWLNHSPHSNS